MRHLLKHMFAVRVVCLMIFCAHICTVVVPVHGNSMTNTDAAPKTSAAELTHRIPDSEKNEMVTTASVLQLKLVTPFDASTEKSLRVSPVVLQRVEKSLVNGTILGDEQTGNSTSNRGTNNTTAISATIGNGIALRFISTLEPIVEFLRMLAKRSLISYNWYQPELQLSNCMMKYARKQYPEMMRHLRMSNIGKLGHNLYSALSEFIKNAISGPQYDELRMEHGRIGTKVAQMARNRPTARHRSRTRQQRQNANAGRRPQAESTSRHRSQNSSEAVVVADDTKTNWAADVEEHTQPEYEINVTEEPRIEAKLFNEPRHTKDKRSLDIEPIMFVGPRQFPPYALPSPIQESLNPDDDDINLTDKPTEEIVEGLFDWESVILEGLGVDPKSIHKFSPMYCGKEYVFGFIKRVFQDLVMA